MSIHFIWRVKNLSSSTAVEFFFYPTIFIPAKIYLDKSNFHAYTTLYSPQYIDEARCVNCVFQMWMSARSLPSPHASISVSTLWAPSAASVTLDTSCQDIAASVSHLNLVGLPLRVPTKSKYKHGSPLPVVLFVKTGFDLSCVFSDCSQKGLWIILSYMVTNCSVDFHRRQWVYEKCLPGSQGVPQYRGRIPVFWQLPSWHDQIGEWSLHGLVPDSTFCRC